MPTSQLLALDMCLLDVFA
ncbi:DUF645 family protein [Vibrio mimicus]|nr:DUF645 family protein [Vibrio mimicus]